MTAFKTKSIQYFEKKGWRITIAVRLILDILDTSHAMLSVRNIQSSLKGKNKNINPSTIYRILERLEAAHLVHAFEGRWKPCSYPENTSDEHHFLICNQCQGVEEIFLDYKSAIADQLVQEKNFLLKKVHLGFFGICKHCHSEKR